MRCPKCQAELAGAPKYCGECGYNVQSEARPPALAPGAAAPAQEDIAAGDGDEAVKLPAGFSRTLSTDLVLAISHVAAVRELAAGTLQALHLQGMPLLTARQDAHTIRGKTLSPLAEFALAFLKQTAAGLEKSI